MIEVHPIDAFGPGLAVMVAVGWVVYAVYAGLSWWDRRKRRRATHTVDEFHAGLRALQDATRITDTPPR